MSDPYASVRLGDFATALRELQQTPEADRDFTYYSSAGWLQVCLGLYGAARDNFDLAEQKAPKRHKTFTAEEPAIAWFLEGNADEAVQGLRQHAAELNAGRVPYSSDVFGLGPRLLHVALLVLCGRKQEAREVVTRLLASRKDAYQWPWPIAHFLHGDLPVAQFLRAATVDQQMTGAAANRCLCEAEFYVGVSYELRGLSQEARKMFQSCAERMVPVETVWLLARGLVVDHRAE